MKMKNLMATLFAAVALVLCMTSCSKDDDEPVIPTAQTLAGTYTGNLTISVMGTESTDAATYTITKVDDSNVSLTIPSAGSGAMTLPSLTVAKIPATKTTIDGVECVKAYIASESGTIMVNEVEKAYTFTDLTIVSTNGKISITYSLKYGKMPMAMDCTFTSK